jgi:fibronectin type 3 domain-containing protein
VGLTGQFGKHNSLSWQPGQDTGLRNYRIYRATQSGGPYALLSEISSKKTSFTDRRPGPQFFCYVVTALDKDHQESGTSNEVCGQGS